MTLPSRAHQQWHERVMKQLPKIVLHPPYEVSFAYQPGHLHKKDLTNVAESVMDLLVDAGILQDDNYWSVPCITLKRLPLQRVKPYGEVTIYSSDTFATWQSLRHSEERHSKKS